MNRFEFRERIDYCRRELEWLLQQPTDCTTCEHFERPTNCKLYGPIPDDFVSRGCDDWSFDEAPF